MNGIWRNVAWLLLPVVGACEADGGGSNTKEEVTSDTSTGAQPSVPGETSNSAPEPTSEASSSGAVVDPTSEAEPSTSGSGSEPTPSTAQSSAPTASGDSSAPPPIVGERTLGARCERSQRWGALGVNLSSDRTIISGAVSNGVLPSSVPQVAAEEGTCKLLAPRNLFCSSSCATSQACAGDDVCVDKPSKVSAGKLRVEGLLTEVEVAPNAITGDYSKTVIDPFPAYTPGDVLTLRAEGDVVGAFEAELIGVPRLSSPLAVVAVKRGEAAVLSWDAESADPEETAVFLSFSVNVHGAVTGWIECTAPDTGEFEIPATLVSQLIDLGSSGFPRVDIERRSSATVELEAGCVELYVGSKITLDIELDGLTSCHGDDDCADGQTCNDELACE